MRIDLWPIDLNVIRDYLLIKEYLPTKFELSRGKAWSVAQGAEDRQTDIATDMPIGWHVQSNMPLPLPRGGGGINTQLHQVLLIASYKHFFSRNTFDWQEHS